MSDQVECYLSHNTLFQRIEQLFYGLVGLLVYDRLITRICYCQYCGLLPTIADYCQYCQMHAPEQ